MKLQMVLTVLQLLSGLSVGYFGREVWVRPSTWAAYALAVSCVALFVSAQALARRF